MRKILFFLVAVCTITACSSDPPESSIINSRNITGYWECTAMSIHQIESTNENSRQKVIEDVSGETGTHWRFENNGKCYEYDWDFITEYNYVINGNVLERWYADYDKAQHIFSQFSISGNTMVIYEDDSRFYTEDYGFPGVTKVVLAFNYVRK